MAERSMAVGVFENHQQAEQAIHALEKAGFSDDQMGFIMRGHKQEGIAGVISGVVGGVIGGVDATLLPVLGPTDAGTALENAIPLSEEAIARFLPSHPKAPSEEGTASTVEQSQAQEQTESTENGENMPVPVTKISVGEAEGAVGGGIVGGLVAAAASLLIPGIGPALAGGILITALGGAAIGAFTGSLLGVFADMGIPREEAHYYQRQLEAGHVLVTARAEGRMQEALDIMRQNGATLYQ
jgi:hypothetical protein